MKRLSPTLDITFKILFSQDEELLISLLTAVLQPTTPIASAKVLDTELSKDNVDDKGSFLDIRVRLDSGQLLDVEMQARSVSGNNERWLYYWAQVYRSQLKKSGDYRSLKPCVGILFLDYEQKDGRFHGIYEIMETSTGRKFSNGLQFHTLELPRLTPELVQSLDSSQNANALLYRWCRFLKTNDPDEIAALKSADPMIRKAEQRLEKLSADPAVRSQIEERQRQADGLAIIKGAIHHQALRQGREEGRENSLRETIRLVCQSFNIVLTPERETQLSAKGSDLQALFASLMKLRAWPE